MNFWQNLRERKLNIVELGPSAVHRAISMCLRPTFTNGDKAIRPLEPSAIASGTNYISGFISFVKGANQMLKMITEGLRVQFSQKLSTKYLSDPKLI